MKFYLKSYPVNPVNRCKYFFSEVLFSGELLTLMQISEPPTMTIPVQPEWHSLCSPWRNGIKTSRTGNIYVETRHALSLPQTLSLPTILTSNFIFAGPVCLKSHPVYPVNRCKISVFCIIFRICILFHTVNPGEVSVSRGILSYSRLYFRRSVIEKLTTSSQCSHSLNPVNIPQNIRKTQNMTMLYGNRLI